MSNENRQKIVDYLDERLHAHPVDDSSVNGLQVQGTATIKKIGLATDAALAVYREAVRAGCELIITHHGLIWKGIRSVTDRNYDHIKFLIENDLNLFASHLPLDLHADLGNNAELARLIHLVDREPFGNYHGSAIGYAGKLPKPMSADQLANAWQTEIGGKPSVLAFGPAQIQSVGIVSGGGSGILPEAIAQGLDCFVTGEGNHADHHLALEGAINVIYLGHYHSETVGVQALGRDLEQRFGVETVFIDMPTQF